MSRRIPSSEDTRIYDFYKKKLSEGVPLTYVYAQYNKVYGTNYAESSLRNRYQRELLVEGSTMSEADILEKEKVLALQESRIVVARQKLSRQRSNMNHELKRYADKSLVAEIFEQVFGEEVEERPRLVHSFLDTDSVEETIWAFGDVHYGYFGQDEHSTYYDPEEAEVLLSLMFEKIAQEEQGSDEDIVIVDLGDSIEGRALRITQLETTAIDMAQQVKGYARAIKDELMGLAQECPKRTIYYHIVTDDNHSQLRLFGTGRNDLTDNMAHLIGAMLEETFETHPTIHIVAGDEHVIETAGPSFLFTHGHQYSPDPSKFRDQVGAKFGYDTKPLTVLVRGHFHQHAVQTANMVSGFMETVITAPPIVPRTDFGDRLHRKGCSGFMKLSVSALNPFTNVKLIPLD